MRDTEIDTQVLKNQYVIMMALEHILYHIDVLDFDERRKIKEQASTTIELLDG